VFQPNLLHRFSEGWGTGPHQILRGHAPNGYALNPRIHKALRGHWRPNAALEMMCPKFHDTAKPSGTR